LGGVAGGLGLEVVIALLANMIVRETARGDQNNVSELEVADG
jgi:hypothetical protein